MAEVAGINRKLNLVIPIARENYVINVFSMPISREVFQNYYKVIARTLTAVAQIGTISSPRVAALVMKEEAEALGTWDGPGGVAAGLMGEIRRLTNVLVPNDSGGWDTVPWQEAIDKKRVDDDEVSEVENALVYFTVASSMFPRAMWPTMIDGALKLWDARTTSWNFMEFQNSLRTLTAPATTGATAAA